MVRNREASGFSVCAAFVVAPASLVSRATQIDGGVADNFASRMQEEAGYYSSDNQIRPCALQPRNQPGGNDDSDVGQCVVTTEEPNCARTCVATVAENAAVRERRRC